MGVEKLQQLNWTDGFLLNCTTICWDQPAKNFHSCRNFGSNAYGHEKIFCVHVGVNDHFINRDQYFQQ